MANKTQTATLGGGCFWCVEAVLTRLRGVHKVTSGYAGGHVDNPTYEQVCSGTTGHAEVVQIAFDPETISFGEILEVFFATHDPTTLNVQGADRGTQYRSVIFYTDEAQQEIATQTIAELNAQGVFGDPIVTEVSPLDRFYPAESYHDDYYARNANQPYCQFTIDPKVAKLRARFADKLKDSGEG
jgi:peptide-methionine (S)-S-oxide reductase